MTQNEVGFPKKSTFLCENKWSGPLDLALCIAKRLSHSISQLAQDHLSPPPVFISIHLVEPVCHGIHLNKPGGDIRENGSDTFSGAVVSFGPVNRTQNGLNWENSWYYGQHFSLSNASQMSPHDMFSGQFIEWDEQSKKAKVAAGVITQVRLGNDHQHQVNDQEWQKYHSGLSRIGEGVGDEDEDEGDHQLKEEGGERARTWRTWTLMNWQISEN